MAVTVVGSTGWIEIPKEFMERHSVKPGDIVRIVAQPDGKLTLKIGKDGVSLVGKLSNNGKHLSIEDINRVIAKRGLSPTTRKKCAEGTGDSAVGVDRL